MKIFVYDIEIKNAIPDNKGQRQPGIRYCGGWYDHRNMGISVLCGFDMATGTMHTLRPEDSAEDATTLQRLLSSSEYIVGHNNHNFDNKVLAELGFIVPAAKSYDIFEQSKYAANADRYAKGYSLDNLATVNGLKGKLAGMSGSMAPMLYQSGKAEDFAKLCEYCQQDVNMTYGLVEAILAYTFIDPITLQVSEVKTPAEVLGAVQTGLGF